MHGQSTAVGVRSNIINRFSVAHENRPPVDTGGWYGGQPRGVVPTVGIGSGRSGDFFEEFEITDSQFQCSLIVLDPIPLAVMGDEQVIASEVEVFDAGF